MVPSFGWKAPRGGGGFWTAPRSALAPDHAAQVLAYDKAMRERNRLLRDGVRDSRWFSALEAQMSDAGGGNHRKPFVRPWPSFRAQADPDSPFPMAEMTLDCTAPDDLAGALADSRARDMAAGRSLIGPHRADLRAILGGQGNGGRAMLLPASRKHF